MRRTLCFLLFFLAAGTSLFADPTGRIRGTVKDPDGKPIPKVTITIEATGNTPQKYSTTTNDKGEYVHIGIKPGDYKVTPSKDGYTPVDFSYATLHIPPSDKPEKANFTMQALNSPAASATQEEKKEPPVHAKAAEEGIKLLNEGKYDQAISEFQKVLQADPSLAEVHYNIGIAYDRKKQPGEAQQQYMEAIKLKPDFGDAYFALGSSYLAEKKSDQAADAFKKATELMPQSYEAFYNLGAACANQMKYSEAESAFKKATEINPQEPVAHYQLGMAYFGQSKNAEAKAEFMKYLELNPNAADKNDVEELIKSL